MITSLVIILFRLPGKIYRRLKKIFIVLFIPKEKNLPDKSSNDKRR